MFYEKPFVSFTLNRRVNLHYWLLYSFKLVNVFNTEFIKIFWIQEDFQTAEKVGKSWYNFLSVGYSVVQKYTRWNLDRQAIGSLLHYKTMSGGSCFSEFVSRLEKIGLGKNTRTNHRWPRFHLLVMCRRPMPGRTYVELIFAPSKNGRSPFLRRSNFFPTVISFLQVLKNMKEFVGSNNFHRLVRDTRLVMT